MARLPNKEQEDAIKSLDCGLLVAGAGSGKTFVIVEKIFYLAAKELSKNSDPFLVENFFKKKAVVTFTEKAAEELKARIFREVKARIENDLGNKSFWILIEEKIKFLFVGTIHSLCSMALQSGACAYIKGAFEIITDVEHRLKVKKIIEKIPISKEMYGDFTCELFLYNHDQVVQVFSKIMQDSATRVLWNKDLGDDKLMFNCEENFWKEFFLINASDIQNISSINISDYKQHSEKKWFLILDDFLKILSEARMNFMGITKKIDALFVEHQRMSSPDKRLGLVNLVDAFRFISKFKSFFKKNMEFLNAFFCESKPGMSWEKLLRDVFKNLENNYLSIPGLSFSDLEYYCYQGLRNQQFELFDYLIVDEFQDTSEIQYDILKRLLTNQGKIFCVGDKKQAIYRFRGGEIELIDRLESEKANALFLTNNYRSCPNIIRFNNAFYSWLMPEISLEQAVPGMPGIEGNGVVAELVLDKCLNEDLGEEQKCLLESELIAKKIIDLKKNHPRIDIAVLYKKISPSRYLLKTLKANNLSYRAQVKLELLDDPIFIILMMCTEHLLKAKHEKDFFNLHQKIKGILYYLDIRDDKFSIELIKKLHKDYSLYGLKAALDIFLIQTGIRNSFFSYNLDLFDKIIEMHGSSLEKIFLMCEEQSKRKYSISITFGNDTNPIQIMTVHSSKGLEFDAVILGGINGNDNYKQRMDMIGKLPGSYKWKRAVTDKTWLKTPAMIMEEMIDKIKECQEGKRLLYVATTRARKFLIWPDLKLDDGEEDIKESTRWIKYFRIFKKQGVYDINSEGLVVDVGSLSENDNFNPPIFHQDSVGIIDSLYQRDIASIGVVGELSATKIVALYLCPRKFYLESVLHIDQDNLVSWSLNYIQETDDKEFVSDAKRGTRLHLLLSKYVLSRDEHILFPRGMSIDNQLALGYAKNLIDSICGQIKSELEVKFLLGGQMISAVLDLFIETQDHIEIWDFKTGGRCEEKMLSYLEQLKLYAYGIYQTTKTKKKVHLLVVWIDEKCTDRTMFEYVQIEDAVSSLWSKISDLSIVNNRHCLSCIYNKLCNLG